MDNNPKILLATLTSKHKDYCFDLWAKHLKRLTYPLDILIIDNTPEKGYAKKISRHIDNASVIWMPRKKGEAIQAAMCRCYNGLRERFLLRGYDYWFSLESDHFPPINVVEYLLGLKAKVACLPYFIHKAFQSKVIAYDTEDFGNIRTAKINTLGQSFIEFDGKPKNWYNTGLGCHLVHRTVLKKIHFRTDMEDGTGSHPDTYFHEDLRDIGIPCTTDTNYFSFHQNSSWFNFK
jgi:hypothetical protein